MFNRYLNDLAPAGQPSTPSHRPPLLGFEQSLWHGLVMSMVSLNYYLSTSHVMFHTCYECFRFEKVC